MSLVREYELLEDATVIRRYDKSRFPPQRRRRRRGRQRAPASSIRLGTEQEHVTPSSGRYEMQAGERFLLQSAGGGGYGDPAGAIRRRLPAISPRAM